MIEIFTDGSAVAHKTSKHCGEGGFGIAFVIRGKIVKEVSEGYKPTKTGRMELKAILKALKMVAKDQKFVLFSDSMYAINCFNKNWLRSWEREDWPERIKNQDILKKLLEEIRKFPAGSYRFKHVKGHTGNVWNEKADELASYKNFTEFKKDL